MLELNARNFLAAVTELRAIQLLLQNIPDKSLPVQDGDLPLFNAHLNRMTSAIEAIGSRSAFRSAERLARALEQEHKPNYAATAQCLADIESRFADHLDDILLLVVFDQQTPLFGDAASLMADDSGPNDDIVVFFPSATFEVEEAAKCLALGRPTASAFHSMRMLEIGIKALAAHLEIPDPVKATDRNWGNVLGAIKARIDERFPKGRRLPDTDGANLEALYATLDAVKNPWRNATMHVETVYTDADASHIFHCCIAFLRKLMARCDEDGLPVAQPI